MFPRAILPGFRGHALTSVLFPAALAVRVCQELSHLVFRPCQETRYPNRIEIKHLRAGQFAFAEAIQAKHLFIYAVSIAAAPALVPQHYNIVAVSGNDLRVHFSFPFSRLGIATVVSEHFHRWYFQPLEQQLASLH